MTALLSPNPNQAGMQAQMESKLAGMGLKSPSAGGGSGFTGAGSPTVNHYLAPESADAQNKSRLRQNRISAPGTLQPSDRWQGHLDQVIERGTSPGAESTGSNRPRSPAADPRPKSMDFSGKANEVQGNRRSPRISGGVGLGIGQPEASPVSSPFLNNGSWASMVNTPIAPLFTDPKVDNVTSALNMANMQLANANRVALDDARKFRRPGTGTTSRNVSGQYNDDGELISPQPIQPGRNWRSPVMDQFGLGMGDTTALAGLGMNFANMGLGNVQAAQMMALAQAQQLSQAQQLAAANTSAGYGGLNAQRGGAPRVPAGRRSPMLGKSHSPTPDRAAGGGGAGGGAGVMGPDDVDPRVLEDTTNWLRVLRLHVSGQ